LATPVALAKKHHPKPKAKFDYYLLSLSWAPNFCANHPGDHSSECAVGGHTAFVLHGLWPQASSGPPPLSCAPASPISKTIIDHMLNFMPTRALVQHEWEKHGTCSSLSAKDYFAKVEQAFQNTQVPDQFKNLAAQKKFGVSDIEQSFAGQNHAPQQAFRISCHFGNLVGLEVCLNKDLQYQACTATVRECSFYDRPNRGHIDEDFLEQLEFHIRIA
jgi:ribonuclease T2